MAKITIDIHELRSNSGNEAVEDLSAFLKEKLGTEIDVSSNEILLETEKEKSKELSRSYLRVLLKKFLHKTELKEDFHVISGKENSFIIKETKVTEEEE
jgi:hypothetical protein